MSFGTQLYWHWLWTGSVQTNYFIYFYACMYFFVIFIFCFVMFDYFKDVGNHYVLWQNSGDNVLRRPLYLSYRPISRHISRIIWNCICETKYSEIYVHCYTADNTFATLVHHPFESLCIIGATRIHKKLWVALEAPCNK